MCGSSCGKHRSPVSIPQAVWGLLQSRYWDLCWRRLWVSIPQAVWGLLQSVGGVAATAVTTVFQYRKRYEVYCNYSYRSRRKSYLGVSIPQAVWGLLQCVDLGVLYNLLAGFNTASGMRSIAMAYGFVVCLRNVASFNTASGMRSIAIVWEIHGAVWKSWFQYRKRYEVYCND